MRIGILTGGGDAPGLNAVIRSCGKSLYKEFKAEKIIGFRDGFKGMVLKDYLELKDENLSGLLHRGGTILGTTNRDNPFKFKVDGQIKDMSSVVVENYKNLNLDCLIVIGGDGTLAIANELSLLGVNVIGVPKTIDNDLALTDTTFGFMTAVDMATEALDRLHTTAESHHRVNILETMGRNAGWIALFSGVAGGADVILLPEIPYSLDKIIEKINYRKKRGKKFSIIIIAEGALEKGSSQTYLEKDRLGGIGNKLAAQLETEGIEARCTVLGHLQRGGTPNAYDRLIATSYGYMAAQMAAFREYNMVVINNGSKLLSVPIGQVSGIIKNVPIDHDLIKGAAAIGVSFGT